MSLLEKKCVPCEGKVSPLTDVQEDAFLKEIPTWHIDRTSVHHLRKRFAFSFFMKAIDFVNRVALIAEQHRHHPNINISFTKVSIDLWTHAIGGLSENDFILAAKIDNVEKKDREHEKAIEWSI